MFQTAFRFAKHEQLNSYLVFRYKQDWVPTKKRRLRQYLCKHALVFVNEKFQVLFEKQSLDIRKMSYNSPGDANCHWNKQGVFDSLWEPEALASPILLKKCFFN